MTVTQEPPVYKHITITKLHPTFVAEVSGPDLSTVTDELFAEIKHASSQYGVLIFRKTNLTDETLVDLAQRFGDMDDATPYTKTATGSKSRIKTTQLFDMSNVEADGTLTSPHHHRWQFGLGNTLFHVDASYNPRRAGHCLLLAHEVPPPGNGGQTAFADTRTAFDELPSDLKTELIEKDYIANHSIHHSRKLAAPEYFAHVNPKDHPMGRHKIVQRHETSGRMNLYIAAHIHHIDGLGDEESQDLTRRLMEHATQEKYVTYVEWESPGDLVIWDNTCVMHKVVMGSYLQKYRRDLRRAVVHDGSEMAWGLNERGGERQAL